MVGFARKGRMIGRERVYAFCLQRRLVKNMETRKLIFYYWCPIKLLLLHCNKNIGAKSNKTVNMTAKIHGFMLKHQQRLMLIVLCKRQAFIY